MASAVRAPISGASGEGPVSDHSEPAAGWGLCILTVW